MNHIDQVWDAPANSSETIAPAAMSAATAAAWPTGCAPASRAASHPPSAAKPMP